MHCPLASPVLQVSLVFLAHEFLVYLLVFPLEPLVFQPVQILAFPLVAFLLVLLALPLALGSLFLRRRLFRLGL